MFTVRTNCIPNTTTEEVLQAIHQDLVKAAVSFKELNAVGITDQNSMLVLFPGDLMQYGIGEEIFIEALDLDASIELPIRNDLAAKLGMVLHTYFSQAKITCKVRPRNREDGTWEL